MSSFASRLKSIGVEVQPNRVQPQPQSNNNGPRLDADGKIELDFSIDEMNAENENADYNTEITRSGVSPTMPFDEVELYPRQTLIKMLQTKGYDENFTFKCRRGKGPDYIQAMRQHLSRGRQVASKKKMQLAEFKLLTVGIQTFPTYDVVTVVRTTHKSQVSKGVYETIAELVANEVNR